MKVFVVGRSRPPHNNSSWECMGVFSTEELALAAATGETDFIGPLELDKKAPEETVDWPGAYFPNQE